MTKYEFRQRVTEYTHIEAENEEIAWEIFNSGGEIPIQTDYSAAPEIKEI